ncbi:uncharacterized protein LOC131942384 [Physella acuta]|uniref:uncharacterized protein LOC131942384 n=1 Tax=Physella acuta TaxID=109671 RepID=UPI0027DCE7D7|nr:uncharacterized protein LOC131942384 [Physella acuta]
MMSWASCLVVAGTLCSQLNPVALSKIGVCRAGHFYDTIAEKCKKCSLCPANQLVKTQCSQFADLECGSLDSNIDVLFDTKNGVLSIDVDTGTPKRTSKEKPSLIVNEDEGPTVEKEDREYWKTLAFALIGLLSVLIIVATVIVLMAFRKLQKVAVIKQPEENDIDDTDSGYVVIRAIRNIGDPRPVNSEYNVYSREDYEAHPPLLTSSTDMDLQSVCDPSSQFCTMPGRLCFLPKVYKPQRRLLNYDADDVFESDDSGASCSVAVRNKLQPVTETKTAPKGRPESSLARDATDPIV